MIGFGDTRSLYDTHLALFSISGPARAIDIVHISGSMELAPPAGRYAYLSYSEPTTPTLFGTPLPHSSHGFFLEMSALRHHQTSLLYHQKQDLFIYLAKFNPATPLESYQGLLFTFIIPLSFVTSLSHFPSIEFSL